MVEGLRFRRFSAACELVEQYERCRHDDGADAGQDGEDQAPGADKQNPGPERWRDERRNAEHQRDGGEVQARLPAFEQIADDRPRQDPDRAGARPLHQAKGEQGVDRGRERRARCSEREHREPNQHDGLAAEPVGERPDHDRRGREAGDEDRDRRRRFRLRRMEIGLDQRQARQRHVDRQRREGSECGEEEGEAESVDVGTGHRRRAAGGGHVRSP